MSWRREEEMLSIYAHSCQLPGRCRWQNCFLLALSHAPRVLLALAALQSSRHTWSFMLRQWGLLEEDCLMLQLHK